MADPILGQHKIHWEICQQSYKSVRTDIQDWKMIGGTEDSVMYVKKDLCILAYRGTQNFQDVWNDLQLTFRSPCGFNKVAPSIQMLKDFFKTNGTDFAVQITGHSLGGALARCVGKELNLNVVTFNAAAPPNGVIQTRPLPEEVNYHIVCDLISAWQMPNCVRIDKGFRPSVPPINIKGLTTTVKSGMFLYSLQQMFSKAHGLASFSSAVPGRLMSGAQESILMDAWIAKFPPTATALLIPANRNTIY